jgi:hypothetical protein
MHFGSGIKIHIYTKNLQAYIMPYSGVAATSIPMHISNILTIISDYTD